MTVPVEIQDLSDNPRETLHVELKSWVGMQADIQRAKIARHLAALANHGGGYLIFGFDDDGTPLPAPPNVADYNADAITGILDRYLSPGFQCDVFVVPQTARGDVCVVVRVPSHGSVPICSRRNGPHDEKNNPQGIRAAQYYIRVPGPKSIAIQTPDQWHDLIHRCVINERETLLQSFGRLLSPDRLTQTEDGLERWHADMKNLILDQQRDD